MIFRISIHALTKSATLWTCQQMLIFRYFNPRLTKSATLNGSSTEEELEISIHALTKSATIANALASFA